MRKTFMWDDSLEAVKRDLRDYGFDPDYRDIVDGIMLAEKMKFNAETISRLVGYTVAVQMVCDKEGIKIPFSPIDIDPVYRKLRRDSMNKKNEAAKRLASGAKPHSQSDARSKPWERIVVEGKIE